MSFGKRSRWLAAGGAIAAQFGALAYWQLFRRPLPKTSGTVKIDGLATPIEIRRDRWGVPHILADSEHDAWFGQGYAHAQDRLAFMAFMRRLACGRLAEIGGPKLLPSDRLMRTLGLRHVAEREVSQLAPDHLAALEAYCAGVAAGVEGLRALPFELQLTDGGFEPWLPVDMLTTVRILSFGLSSNWEKELLRADLTRALGPELAAKIDPAYPKDHPIAVTPGRGFGGDALHLAGQIDAVRELIGLAPEATGSNNWVVSGARTVTGNPLFAGDPHLTTSMPGIWQQQSVQVGERFARGATLPGFPGFWMGQINHGAWSITNAMADTMDLFIERVDGDRYEFEGELLPLEVRHEEIRVRGRRQPEVLEVRSTHHGPIVTDILGGDPAEPLALAWGSLAMPALGDQQVRLLEFDDIDTLVGAFEQYNGPVSNLLYCSKDGDIGYRMIGRLPLRRGGCPDLPKPGWTGEFEWDGWVPFDEMPEARNPECGYLVTANNRIVDEDYPHHVTSDWLEGYRARRITDLIESRELHDADSFQRMLSDVYSIPGMETARRLAELVAPGDGVRDGDAVEIGERERDAIERLRRWDGRLDPSTVAGTIYNAFTMRFAREFSKRVIGDEDLVHRYLDGADNGFIEHVTTPWRWHSHLLALWEDADSELIGGSWDELALASLGLALDDLTERYGADKSAWRWGVVHRLDFPHLLADGSPLLDRLFSRNVEIGGGHETVCQVAYNPVDPYKGIWAPSWRMVADPCDPIGARWQTFTGQSGHPASKHYDDIMDRWRDGEMQPMAGVGPWHNLTLRPKRSR
ncbi:MAG: penicillin acylase family protein [Actinobacteria bacterium]|nr:penicillin acylase family protein [Actinomycetota bacterium]